MKTYDLKRSDREKKAAMERFMEPMPYGEGSDYHHGLQVSLDDHALKKMGIDELPKPDSKFKIQGGAHVIRSVDDQSNNGGDRRLELMIHELGMEPVGAEPKEKSIRDELEDARHQARGTTATEGRIGARAVTSDDEDEG